MVHIIIHTTSPQNYISRDAQSTEKLFSTQFYHLFQSTDKNMIYGRIYGFVLLRSATTCAPSELFSAMVVMELDGVCGGVG